MDTKRLARGLERGLRVGAAIGLAILALAAVARGEDEPVLSRGLSYMTAFGPKNYSVVSLLYGSIVLSLAVVAIIGIMVLVGSLLRRMRPRSGQVGDVPIDRPGRGLSLIYVGTTLTFFVLLGLTIWDFAVLADVAGPPRKPAFTITVVGHQWWWEYRYDDGDVSRNFTTANEAHIPVGQPVRIELLTADVIHSFWVPALSGKTDTIPGQQNRTWIQADKPGFYRGSCTEYCGQQHAHMGLMVVADPPDQFRAWWDRQLQPPAFGDAQPQASAAERGEQVFMRRCAVCHTVRGTQAQGRVGPDLSHLMERHGIAAESVPNNIGYLSAWISDPQRIKPGNLMPTIDVTPAELTSLRSFLQALR